MPSTIHHLAAMIRKSVLRELLLICRETFHNIQWRTISADARTNKKLKKTNEIEKLSSFRRIHMVKPRKGWKIHSSISPIGTNATGRCERSRPSMTLPYFERPYCITTGLVSHSVRPAIYSRNLSTSTITVLVPHVSLLAILQYFTMPVWFHPAVRHRLETATQRDIVIKQNDSKISWNFLRSALGTIMRYFVVEPFARFFLFREISPVYAPRELMATHWCRATHVELSTMKGQSVSKKQWLLVD